MGYTTVMAAVSPVSTPAATAAPATPPARQTTPGSGLGTTPGSGTNFTSFPASYAGFGSDGSGFGSLTVKNGSLAVAPATTDANSKQQPQTAASADDNSGVFLSLVNARERVAFAQASDNSAAVTQLQPLVTQLTGQYYNQEFAGLGQTPAQPFAQPEIPRLFLNVGV